MKTKRALRQKGFVLIEALVAIVVVMVGALGIIKLNAVLLGGTGVTKTQAEALQIAQQRIEVMRNYVLSTGCVDSTTVGTTTTATSLTGTNASFRIDTVVSAGTVGSEKVIDACVAWDGSSNACTAASDKRVLLRTSVACSGVGTSGLINLDSSGGTGSKLKTPTGAARVGGNSQTAGTGTVNVLTGTTIADGTRTYVDSSGAHILLDAAGKALLTIENPDDGGFSTISGRVYIETNNSGNPIVDPQGSTTAESDDTVFVLSSDASYCARVFPTLPVPSSGTAKYRYFDYNCYVSKGWWGNIGVVRLDNPNDNNRVCLGDMAVDSSEASIWSKKANLSISRGYRAYKIKNPNGSTTDQANFDTVGIGFALQNDGTLSSTYSAVNFGGSRTESHHDFLVTLINGQGTCEGSGNMKLVSGDTNASNQFTGNLGRFYCMTGQCPGLVVSDTVQTTVISGTITKVNGAVLTGIDVADCQTTPTFTDNGSTYSYSCTKTWTGFSGSSWQGGVTFTTASGNTSTICPNASGSAPTVVPTGNAINFLVNDRTITENQNTLAFTSVPLGVTSIVIDLNAEASSCPLGSYTVTYNGNGNSGGTVPDPVTFNSGSATIVASVGSMTKPGYTFAGWNTAANGSGTGYPAGTNIVVTATLYAQWVAIPYNVTYNGNGNTTGTAPVDASSPYTYLDTVTVKSNTGLLNRPGYTLDGWTTAANGTGTAYAVGATFAISASTTLYAKWTPILYTVSFNSNGGNALTSQSVAYNTTATTPTAPTKTGLVFVGWYRDIGLTNAFVFSTPITVDTTLYAKWQLRTPQPTWPGTSSMSMLALSWSSVSPATSYTLLSCNLGTQDLTCTPGTSASVQSGTSYTPPAYSGNVKGRCYSVTATNGVDSDSAASSPPKCVKGSGPITFN